MSNEPENLLKIHMPGAPEGTYTPLGYDQVKRVYSDDAGPRLIVVIDEAVELLEPSGIKNEEGKEVDALKMEMQTIIASLTRLARSVCINVILCVQRNDKSIISGQIQNNSLDPDTKVLIRRKKDAVGKA